MLGKCDGREGMDSEDSVEERGREGRGGRQETKVEMVMGVKEPEI